MEVDDYLPSCVKYWLMATSRNDCFFVLGSESSGQTERIGAIKIFLFGYSESLRNMLENSQLAEQGDVRIVDIEPKTFWNFLKCVYGGSDVVISKLSFQESVNLLYLVEKYLVTDMKPKIVSHIQYLLPKGNLVDNIFCAMSNPVCFSDSKLDEAIMETICCKVSDILSSELFFQLSSQSVLRIVKADCLDTSEMAIWDAVLKWAKHTIGSSNGEILRMEILAHLKFIRVCTFGCEEFCKKVVTTGILTSDEVIEVCKYFATGVAPQLEYICNSTDTRCRRKGVTEKTFYHIVNDISELKSTGYKSQLFTFENYSWNIEVQKLDNNLALYVRCNGNSKGQWKTKLINVEMSLVNQERNKKYSMCFAHCFCNRDGGWGSKNFLTWDELTDGYEKDNTIIVKAHLKIDLNQKETD